MILLADNERNIKMINFENIKEISIPNLNGGNGKVTANMFISDNVKIMKSVIGKNCSIGVHTHTTSSEIFLCLKGTAKCILDGKEEIIRQGECHFCPKVSAHSIDNISDEDLVFFEVVPEY